MVVYFTPKLSKTGQITPSGGFGWRFCYSNTILSFSFLFISTKSLKNHSKSQKNHKIKNHSKSQKNHKMKNLIVLDSKWVDLHSEHIIWYALIYFLYSYEEKYRSKAAAKKYIKAYYIIRSLCRSTHLESNTIRFSILWFFCDLLWIYKTILGVIWMVLESSRGDIDHFIVWGVM